MLCSYKKCIESFLSELVLTNNSYIYRCEIKSDVMFGMSEMTRIEVQVIVRISTFIKYISIYDSTIRFIKYILKRDFMRTTIHCKLYRRIEWIKYHCNFNCECDGDVDIFLMYHKNIKDIVSNTPQLSLSKFQVSTSPFRGPIKTNEKPS